MSKTTLKSGFDLDLLIRPSVKAISPYSSARDEFSSEADDLIFLDANENPFGQDINRYPDPYQNDLKAALAKLRKVKKEQVFIGNGSDEVLDLLFRAFCIPGSSNVITLPPTYGMYSVLSGINEAEVRPVPLDENWQPKTNEILEAADEHTKMVFLCSPNNPTGNTMDPSRVTALLESFRGLVVIDEAYIDFAPGKSWAEKLDKYPNLVIVQTLSKAFGLAGIRVGFAITSPEIVRLLNTIKPPYNVNFLSQQKALETLKQPRTADMLLYSVEVERAWLIQELNTLEFVNRVFPSEANFILIRVDNADKRYRQLLNNGIVVRNRSKLPGCEQTLRITIGTPEENRTLIAICNQLK